MVAYYDLLTKRGFRQVLTASKPSTQGSYEPTNSEGFQDLASESGIEELGSGS